MTINSGKTYKQYLNLQFDELRKDGKVVVPSSMYFGQIGSTALEDIEYQDQLEVKLGALKIIFQDLINAELLRDYQIVPSSKKFEYRFKMDFVCSFNPFEDPKNKFGQRQKKRFNKVVDMFECNLVDSKWFTKTRKIYDFLSSEGIVNYDLVKHTGNLRYLVLKHFENEAMLSIVTKEDSNDEVISKAAELALQEGFKSVYWLQNNSLNDDSTGNVLQVFGEEYIQVPLGRRSPGTSPSKSNSRIFKVGHNTFFQNNIFAFEEIIKHTQEFIEKQISNSEDYVLYDFFSGTGILGILFSRYFSLVKGFDVVKESINLAAENLLKNDIKNAVYEVKDLYKEELIIDNDKKVVIVDPPRTGLMKNGVELVKKLNADYVIYISCNPLTQAQDLDMLKELYEVETIRAFDLFPQTYHVENVAILKRLRTGKHLLHTDLN